MALGVEDESGPGEEGVDEGGPVLDALEPVLDDGGDPCQRPPLVLTSPMRRRALIQRSRTISRRARPTADRPPPSGYLMTCA
jgi:hypothetical protein